jgi:preprotein translocase subunit SecD
VVTPSKPDLLDGLSAVSDRAVLRRAQGTQRFADATREAIGKQIAIILDGQVVSAPVVQAPIQSGQGVITCACDEERAKALAAQLNGGA